MVVALTKTLTESVSLPTPAAIDLANRLIDSPTGTVQLSQILTITLDANSLRESTLDRLAHAVEVTPHPTRGRPRGS